MSEEAKKKKSGVIIAIVAVIVLAALCVGLWFLNQKNKDKPVEGGKSITLQIISERDSVNTEDKYDTAEEYLGDFLANEGIIGYDTSDYGRFITSVKGYASNDAEQAWWSVAVNGEMAMTGIDEIVLEDGSVYTLELKIGW